jgi:predicted ATP-binding protein involved in virulence
MKLDEIKVINFRKFEQLSCTLHPNLTVLVSENGGGKTTLLDAIRIAVWPFVKGFDLGSQTGKSATIQNEDVRLVLQEEGNMEPQTPSKVIVQLKIGTVDEMSKTLEVERTQVKRNTGNSSNKAVIALTKQAKKLQEQVREGRDKIDLPLISYLGTSRVWYQGRNTTQETELLLDVRDYSRTSAYLNCLSFSSSYKAFAIWYRHIYESYRESQNLVMEKMGEGLAGKLVLDELGQRNEDAIRVIQSSVDEVIKHISGWYKIEYSVRHQKQIVMHHDELGVLPIDMLSDGLRNAIAIVADIAFRAYKLNPHMGKEAAKRTSGIVMIDEVDMFLHPKWQQTILPSLQEAFPKIQFIVTTHSPQVLTSVPSDCIRVIQDGKVFSAPQGSEGSESKRMLERVFGAKSRPKNNAWTNNLKDYRDYVYSDKWVNGWSDEMLRLKSELHHHFGGEDPELTELDLYLENREWELNLEKNQ